MVIIVGVSFAALLLLIVAGFPLAILLRAKLFPKEELHGPTTLALAVLGGFAVSAFASSWSYGLIGIDSYPLIFCAILIISWLLIIIKSSSLIRDFFQDWKKSDLGLLVPVLFSVYLSRPYWSSLLEPMMRAGDGPDTTQNLMAAQSARSLGGNWFKQAEQFNQFVGVENLREGVMQLYRLPSFRDQAGIDYLVYGTRWGLTVPYSQVLRFAGNYSILWETGVVLLTSLIALSLVIFSTSRLISKNPIIPLLVTVAVIFNTPFLVQYFNGGLSQAWAVASTSGFFLALVIILKYTKSEKLENQNFYTVLFILVWLGISVTYIDAAIVIVLFCILFFPTLYMFRFGRNKSILKVVIFSSILSATLVPIFTIATGYTLDYRLKAATGTGIPSQIWPLPSELIGMINIFTSGVSSRSTETLLLALLITGYLIFKICQGVFRRSETSWIAAIGLVSLLTFGVGYLLSITGRQGTNYIYLKVSTYVAPIAIVIFFSLLDHSFNKSAKLSKIRKPYFLILPTLVSGLVLLSGLSANSSYYRLGMTVPYGFKPFLESSETQKELNTYNYLTTYITSSNLLGVLGNVHWISKAPNDLILDNRLDVELRLICFSVDTTCTPNTKRISAPNLESFGLIVYESPITTREFYSFTPKERFDENFKVFGQTPQEIPSRFIGGNPYYND